MLTSRVEATKMDHSATATDLSQKKTHRTPVSPRAKADPKPKPPPTEAEISLDLISKLVSVSKVLTLNSKHFMRDIDTIKSVYSEDIIEVRVLDPLAIAVELKEILFEKDDSLEKVLSGSGTLMELWTSQVYADLEEDEAVKKLTEDFEALNKIMLSKSYKTFLKA